MIADRDSIRACLNSPTPRVPIELPPAVAAAAYNCATRLRNGYRLSGLTSQTRDYRERVK